MFHREEVILRLTPEQASALSAALTCYQLWLDAHPEEQELRQDQPHLNDIEKEMQRQTAQSPQRGSGRPVW